MPCSGSRMPCRMNACLGGRYFITEDEKQATYTGREQRHGVWILPFLVAGLFGRGRPKGGSLPNESTAASGGIGDAQAKRILDFLCGTQGATEGPELAGQDFFTADKSVKAAQTEGGFNWEVYRAACPDTPLHAAVTAMFAEYALLVGRINRRLGAAAWTRMTLSEGISIAQQAQDFILGYVTPILGHLRTTKVHRVLCHVLHSIKYHGNIMNGSTSVNEHEHEADKRNYLRTNKTSTYTRQLVRHATARAPSCGATQLFREQRIAGARETTQLSEMAATRPMMRVRVRPCAARALHISLTCALSSWRLLPG